MIIDAHSHIKIDEKIEENINDSIISMEKNGIKKKYCKHRPIHKRIKMS